VLSNPQTNLRPGSGKKRSHHSVKRNFRISIALAPFAVLSLVSQAQAATPVSGAIFTTVADGSVVNANQYVSKCDVYLDGGPGHHAPASAAALPPGEYFFQVTDPNGQVLLSTDVVNNRRFLVSASGVITAYTGFGGTPHPTGIDQDHPELGAITIRLANTACPTDYLNTPNNGGVYKVWATPITDFAGDPTTVDNTCGNGCFHGFVASKSKTDNFKVKPTTATFCLTVAKQLRDTGTPGFHWEIRLTDASGVTNNYFTNDIDGSVAICGLVAGTYTVAEVVQTGFAVVGLIVNGTTLPAQSIYSFNWTPGMQNPMVVFQNANLLQ
jgi:hypothetical protein